MSAGYTKRLNEKYELKMQRMKEDNKKTICIVNVISTVATCGLAFGTYLLLINNPGVDCAGSHLRLTLWLMLAMHATNIIEAVCQLTHLEKICCGCICTIAFFIYEVAVLVYMQVIFYANQQCADETPDLYWWLLVNIIVYFGFLFTTIFFWCKGCFASVDKKEVQEEVDAETKEILKEAKEHSTNAVN
jgi:Kef-type K+ transport system membrane component KefB